MITNIEALRARMREAAVAVENAPPAPRDPVFSDPQLEAMELFRALASPANVKALDAEITRLRKDLDRVTRERDALLETPGGYWWPSWRKMIDAMVKPGPRCRDCADYDGRCGGDGPPCDPTEHAIENYRKSVARAEAAEAALAKRDEEVAGLREALEIIRDERGKCEICGAPAKGDGAGWVGCDDSNRCTWTSQLARDVAREALTKEPTNAE